MKTLRYLVSLFCAIAFIVFGIYASGVTLLIYFDIASVLCVVGVTIAMLRVCYTFKEMGAAFSAVLSPRPVRAAFEKAELFFKAMRRYLYVSGILSAFLGLIAMFRNFADASRFMPNLAVCIIVIFYSLLLDCCVALPMCFLARRGMKDLE